MYQSRSIWKLTLIAVSLSVLIHISFIVFSVYQKMGGVAPYESKQFVQRVVPVEFIQPEDMPQELMEMNSPQNNEPITNKSFNVADENSSSEQKYDSRYEKSIQEQVEKELKEFEANEFKKLKDGRQEKVSIQNENNPNPNDTKTTSDNEEIKSSSGAMKGRVTAMYELKQRRDEKLAIPAYICRSSGTVKVNIIVDREGLVIEATIDKKGSSYKETCIGENALNYAKKCRFSVSTVAPEMQEGWILYNFISQ